MPNRLGSALVVLMGLLAFAGSCSGRTADKTGDRSAVDVTAIRQKGKADLPVSGTQDKGSGLCIAVIGDSTATNAAGWGEGFQRCLRSYGVFANLAEDGRDAGSFLESSAWQRVLACRPDYLLIEFGNEERTEGILDGLEGALRVYKANLGCLVQWARAAGIKPVLVTPISPRLFDKEGWIQSPMQPFFEATAQVARENQVPVINLYGQSLEIYESLGPEQSRTLAARRGDGLDAVRLNGAGSELFGILVALELRALDPILNCYIWSFDRSVKPSTATVPPPVTRSDAPLTSKGSRTITVSKDGSGDFKTVQEAIAAVPVNNADRTIIHIKPGRYRGPFVIAGNKPNVTLQGEDARTTVLTYALTNQDPMPAGVPKEIHGFGTSVFADNFHAERLTFRNAAGDRGWAITLRLEGDRAILRDCRVTGWQDTLALKTYRQYLRDCYIEGRVDFIYGDATAVFDHCELASRNGGFVTASGTPRERPFGFVFLGCKLTSRDIMSVYLGHPWMPYGSVAYLNCEMGRHIHPLGWISNKDEEQKTARFAEYRNTGPGAALTRRVKWAKRLTDQEAARYTVRNILGGGDGWNPEAEIAGNNAPMGR